MNKRIGVLLINLGTPDSPDVKDVFTYLTEFLTDGRVIDLPWFKRQLLVRGVIIPTRVKQSASQYQALWTPNGSPLMVHGKSVEEKLQHELGDDFHVVLAMRYQSPSIQNGLKKLEGADLDELIVVPLFPQYASATTGSVHEEVMTHLKQWEIMPKITFLNEFFIHPAFIQAFAERAKEYPIHEYDHVLFSFHGLPERQIKKADRVGCCLKTGCCDSIRKENRHCYKAQSYATARAIADKVGIPKEKYTVCFQSRLGKEPWIQPYTTEMLSRYADSGVKRLLVFCPAFICDCLETLYEIKQEYGKEFVDLGGEKLELVEGLNSHPAWIKALKEIIT